MPNKCSSRLKFLLTLCFLTVVGSVSSFGQVSIQLVNEQNNDEIEFRDSYKSIREARADIEEKIKVAQEEGYLTAFCSVVEEKKREEKLVLLVNMELGKHYSYADLELDSALSERYISLAMQDGSRGLSRIVKSALSDADKEGYPFSKIEVRSRVDSSGVIRSILQLDKGALVTLDSIVVKSEVEVNYHSVESLIGISNGDLYNGQKLAQVDAQLKSMPFVKLARPSEVIYAGNSARLFIFLKEKRANRLDALVGFQPDEEGNVVFTGDIDMRLVNSFKRAEQLDFQWSRVRDNSQNLKAGMAYPFLFRSAFGISSGIELYRQDSTFNQVEGFLGVDYSIDNGDKLSVFLNSKSFRSLLEVTSSSADLGSSTNQYGLGLSRSRLNDPYNPRKGLELNLSISAGDKKINSSDGESQGDANSKIQQYEAGMTLRYFHPLGKRATVLIGLNGKTISAPTLLAKELHRIGGIQTLRGFDEQSILASTYAISTIEYRFLFGQDSFISAFFQQGAYEAKTVDAYTSDRPYGFGIGASMATNSGFFNMSYALGSQFANALDLRTGKVHFGYSASF